MCENARSRVCAGCKLSEEFSVTVGVHQDSWLSPLLFTMVLEALSQEFRTGFPWGNLHADDLVIISESLEELQEELILWKTNMEGNDLRVDMGKTRVLISERGLHVLQKSGKDPSTVCLKSADTNSHFLTWLFQSSPQVMQWYLLPSEAWSQLHV